MRLWQKIFLLTLLLTLPAVNTASLVLLIRSQTNSLVLAKEKAQTVCDAVVSELERGIQREKEQSGRFLLTDPELRELLSAVVNAFPPEREVTVTPVRLSGDAEIYLTALTDSGGGSRRIRVSTTVFWEGWFFRVTVCSDVSELFEQFEGDMAFSQLLGGAVAVITAAALLAATVVLLGAAELPLLYPRFFDAAAIVNEQERLAESLKDEPHDFIKGLREPLFQEKRMLSEEAVGAFLADSREYREAGVYERLFEAAGLAYDEVDWSGLSAIDETGNYRIDIETAQENGTVSAVFDMSMPVLLYCGGSSASAEDVEAAVARLEECAETGRAPLSAYLKRIDKIYEGCEAYRNQLGHLLAAVEDMGKQEITAAPTLSECCSHGAWQVYSDGAEAAMVCIIEQSWLVLYYDAASRDFCGFRLGLNVTNAQQSRK